MKHLLKDANGVGNYTPYVDYSGNTITFQNTIWNKVKRNLVLWYDIKRQGATNENMANNPILKDLSGNGHDATCYNFAWNRQSGISSYFDFNLFKYGSNWGKYVKDVTETSFIYYHPGNDNSVMVNANNYVIYPFQIKVTGITDTGLRLEYGQGTIPETESSIKTDGVYTITRTAYGGFKLYGDESITCNIKIEQIAYPNALVSDGVDDYCRVDGLPLLTDYTVIAKRKRLDIDLGHRGAIASKLPLGNSNNGAFVFESSAADDARQAISFGTFSNINFEETDISYQTKNYYNRINIQSGNQLDTDHLSLFSIRERSGCSQAALYSFVLFNRTLTEDEIKKWIRENMDENYLLPNERHGTMYNLMEQIII